MGSEVRGTMTGIREQELRWPGLWADWSRRLEAWRVDLEVVPFAVDVGVASGGSCFVVGRGRLEFRRACWWVPWRGETGETGETGRNWTGPATRTWTESGRDPVETSGEADETDGRKGNQLLKGQASEFDLVGATTGFVKHLGSLRTS